MSTILLHHGCNFMCITITVALATCLKAYQCQLLSTWNYYDSTCEKSKSQRC